MKFATASLILTVCAGPAVAQTDKIPDALKPIAAANRIFDLENHFHGDLGIANAD